MLRLEIVTPISESPNNVIELLLISQVVEFRATKSFTKIG